MLGAVRRTCQHRTASRDRQRFLRFPRRPDHPIPAPARGADVVAELLTLQRGSRVEIRVPQRGDKRSLLETVGRNAEQAFTQHKLRRASDLSARSRALSELQEALGLEDAPLRIECFDVSSL